VGHKPSSELIQSLRATLQKLEENFASTEDHPQMADLKRILLLRIADLEFVGTAVELANNEASVPPQLLPQDPERAKLCKPVIEDDPETA
jgi:hypothetical protein